MRSSNTLSVFYLVPYCISASSFRMASPFIACILDMQKFVSEFHGKASTLITVFAISLFPAAQKPGICDIKLFTHLPAERASISEWERRNACQLPDDLKSFYLTSDGVQMQWSFKCGGEVSKILIIIVASPFPISHIISFRTRCQNTRWTNQLATSQ